jgi:hypothetical protein
MELTPSGIFCLQIGIVGRIPFAPFDTRIEGPSLRWCRQKFSIEGYFLIDKLFSLLLELGRKILLKFEWKKINK